MKSNKIFYGWFILVCCTLMTGLLITPATSVNSQFILPVTEEFGISRTAFVFRGVLISVMGVFVSPIAGKMLQKGDVRKILVGFTLLYIASVVLFAYSPNFTIFMLSGITFGIAFPFVTLIPVNMLLNEWFVAKRGVAVSIAMVGVGLGGFILNPIVGALIKNFDWRTAQLGIAGIVTVVILPLMIFVIRKKPADKNLEPYGVKDGKLVVSENESKEKIAEDSMKVVQPMKDSMFKPFFIVMLLASALTSFTAIGATTQFAPSVGEQFDASTSALVLTIIAGVGMIGKLSSGFLNDKVGVKFTATFFYGFYSLAFIILLILTLTATKSYSLTLLVAVVYGLGTAMSTVLPPLITGTVFGRARYTEAYSLISSASLLGTVGGPLVLSAIFDSTGQYTMNWIILAAGSAGALILWLLGIRIAKKYMEKESFDDEKELA